MGSAIQIAGCARGVHLDARGLARRRWSSVCVGGVMNSMSSRRAMAGLAALVLAVGACSGATVQSPNVTATAAAAASAGPTQAPLATSSPTATGVLPTPSMSGRSTPPTSVPTFSHTAVLVRRGAARHDHQGWGVPVARRLHAPRSRLLAGDPIYTTGDLRPANHHLQARDERLRADVGRPMATSRAIAGGTREPDKRSSTSTRMPRCSPARVRL